MSESQAVLVPVLSDELFALFRQLIQRETGIFMRDGKKLLVSNRVKKRMRQMGVESFPRYFELVRTDHDGERARFVDAVTTNETYFYRGESHFVALRQAILPRLFSLRDRVTMWSTGCSTGEEPYTMAMTALECAPRGRPCVEILATDISTTVVSRAAQAIYDERALRCLPAAWRERYMEQTSKGMRVKDEVRRLVRFSVHNALRDEPPARSIDVIFCRNVMIYFDTATQRRLVEEKFAPSLAADGYLFIGHSESLIGKSRLFTFTRIQHAPVYRLTRKGEQG